MMFECALQMLSYSGSGGLVVAHSVPRPARMRGHIVSGCLSSKLTGQDTSATRLRAWASPRVECDGVGYDMAYHDTAWCDISPPGSGLQSASLPRSDPGQNIGLRGRSSSEEEDPPQRARFWKTLEENILVEKLAVPRPASVPQYFSSAALGGNDDIWPPCSANLQHVKILTLQVCLEQIGKAQSYLLLGSWASKWGCDRIMSGRVRQG